MTKHEITIDRKHACGSVFSEGKKVDGMKIADRESARGIIEV